MTDQNRSVNVPHIIGQAIRDLRRGRAFVAAALIVLTLCLCSTGAFLLLLFNVNRNIKSITGASEAVIYIADNVPTSAEQRNRILAVSGVESARLVTKEDALREERARYAASGLPELADYLTEENNPFRDSYVIGLKKSADLDALRTDLKAIDGVAKVIVNAEIVGKIRGFERGMSLIFTGFGVGLLIVSLFVIFSAVKQAYYARREEISLMRYVGATRTFICAPFVVEGGIIGLISGLASSAILGVVYAVVTGLIRRSSFDFFIVAATGSVMPVTIILLSVCGVTLGTLASLMSVKRYAKG